MALTTCRECGAEISAQATTCPQCGAFGPATLAARKVATGALIGTIALVIVGGLGTLAASGIRDLRIAMHNPEGEYATYACEDSVARQRGVSRETFSNEPNNPPKITRVRGELRIERNIYPGRSLSEMFSYTCRLRRNGESPNDRWTFLEVTVKG